MFRKKTIEIVVKGLFVKVVFFGFVILLIINILDSQNRLRNQINNKNIWWSNEWEKIIKDNQNYMRTQFPGSEFSFVFENSNSVAFRVNTDDIEGLIELVIMVDDKEYELANPNINDKRLVILIPEKDRGRHHNVSVKFYCLVGLSKCEVRLSEIILENGSIVQVDRKKQKKILGVLGDSISLIDLRRNYATFLANGLGYHLHNAAFWGGTIGMDNGKNPAVSRYVRDLTAYKPDIVIIFLGINDINYGASPESFRLDYEKTVKGIKKDLPETRIIAVGILTGMHIDDNYYKIIQFNQLIKEIAKENSIFFVDTTEWLGEDDYGDQVHPNYKGEMKIAENLKNFFLENNINR